MNYFALQAKNQITAWDRSRTVVWRAHGDRPLGPIYWFKRVEL